jgi:hypothetical protein
MLIQNSCKLTILMLCLFFLLLSIYLSFSEAVNSDIRTPCTLVSVALGEVDTRGEGDTTGEGDSGDTGGEGDTREDGD